MKRQSPKDRAIPVFLLLGFLLLALITVAAAAQDDADDAWIMSPPLAPQNPPAMAPGPATTPAMPAELAQEPHQPARSTFEQPDSVGADAIEGIEAPSTGASPQDGSTVARPDVVDPSDPPVDEPSVVGPASPPDVADDDEATSSEAASSSTPDRGEAGDPAPDEFDRDRLNGMNLDYAIAKLREAGQDFRQEAIGTCDQEQVGKVAGFSETPTGPVTLYAYAPAPTMPDLINKPTQAAMSNLIEVGGPAVGDRIRLEGEGDQVLETAPAAGACLQPGEPVTLKVGTLIQPCATVDQLVQRESSDGSVIVFKPNNTRQTVFFAENMELPLDASLKQQFPILNNTFDPRNDSRFFYSVWFPAQPDGPFADATDDRVLFAAYCKDPLNLVSSRSLDLPDNSFGEAIYAERLDDGFALKVADARILVYLTDDASWKEVQAAGNVVGVSLGRAPDGRLRLGYVTAAGELRFEDLTGGGSWPGIDLGFEIPERKRVSLYDDGDRVYLFTPRGTWLYARGELRPVTAAQNEPAAGELLASDLFWADDGSYQGFFGLYRRDNPQGEPDYFARVIELGGDGRASTEIDLNPWLGGIDALHGVRAFAKALDNTFERFGAIVAVTSSTGGGKVLQLDLEKLFRGPGWGASMVEEQTLSSLDLPEIRLVRQGSSKKKLFYLHKDSGNDSEVVQFVMDFFKP